VPLVEVGEGGLRKDSLLVEVGGVEGAGVDHRVLAAG
jgi:hypothetical protein